MYKETTRGKRRWKAHEHFADQRCGQALLAFLASTDVGKVVPAADEEAGSETSEGELWERRDREDGGRRWRHWGPGGKRRCSYPLYPSWHGRGRNRGRARFTLLSFPFFPLFLFLVRSLRLGIGLGGGHRETCNEPPSRGQQ